MNASSGARSSSHACVGNLVDMGKLAFVPATPEVLKLAAHLDQTHEFFGESFYGVFRRVQPHLTPHDAMLFLTVHTATCEPHTVATVTI